MTCQWQPDVDAGQSPQLAEPLWSLTVTTAELIAATTAAIAATTVVTAEAAQVAGASGPDFRVQISLDVRQSCIDVIGELRPQDCHLLRDAVIQLVLSRPALVTVDLSRCSQMGLSGVAVLAHAARVARRLNTVLEVQGGEALFDGVDSLRLTARRERAEQMSFQHVRAAALLPRRGPRSPG